MSAPDETTNHRLVLSSIHNYLQRKGFKNTATSLFKEAQAAGLSLGSSNVNLEDLWNSCETAAKESLLPRTPKGRSQDDESTTDIQSPPSHKRKAVHQASSSSSSSDLAKRYSKPVEVGSPDPSKSKLVAEEESSSSTSETSDSSSASRSDSSVKSDSSTSTSESSSSDSEGSSSSDSSESSSVSGNSTSSSTSSSEESESNSSSAESSSSSEPDEDSSSSEESSKSSDSESSTSTSEESSSEVSSGSSGSSSSSSDPESSDTENSSDQSSNSSNSSSTGSASSSSTSDSDNVEAKEKNGMIASKRQCEETQELEKSLHHSHSSSENDNINHKHVQKKHRTNANHDLREDASNLLTVRDSRQAFETEMVSHETNNETLGDSPKKGSEQDPSTLRRFQRVQPDSVKFIDDKLRDNSYDAKGGEVYGLRAWEELKKVRGKDFRKAKTKKKRATYFGGGTISKDSHSFHFTYSDDST